MHGRLGHLSRIGNAVREARRAAGMTQLSLAISAEIGLAAMRGVESGIGRITSLNAVLNALALEIRGRNLAEGSLGHALALARKRRKLSRRQLARALNVSRNTLASVEAGGRVDGGIRIIRGGSGRGSVPCQNRRGETVFR
jgi:transcriptional regulator with XRE-family HTH domain